MSGGRKGLRLALLLGPKEKHRLVNPAIMTYLPAGLDLLGGCFG